MPKTSSLLGRSHPPTCTPGPQGQYAWPHHWQTSLEAYSCDRRGGRRVSGMFLSHGLCLTTPRIPPAPPPASLTKLALPQQCASPCLAECCLQAMPCGAAACLLAMMPCGAAACLLAMMPCGATACILAMMPCGTAACILAMMPCGAAACLLAMMPCGAAACILAY